MKICSKCKEEKELMEFNKNIRTPDGYQRSCRKCRKIEQSLYYKKNKEFVIRQVKDGKVKRRDRWNAYKNTLSCILCGENHSLCLDFHHIDPNEKDFELSKMRKDFSWDHLMSEVKKCVVLCKNCHVKVHDGVLEI